MFIRLVGLFGVYDDMGQDCTPRGAKARAILAMLCQTPGHCRPRRWIERKLWSDRGQDQASGSLRQALTELRKALGPLAHHLVSDRDCVRLERVETDLVCQPDAARTAIRDGRDFLEGIDIADRAFHDWLAEERQRVSAQLEMRHEAVAAGPDQGGQPPLALRVSSSPDGTEALLERELAAAIARLTAEYLFHDLAEAKRMGKPYGLPTDGLDVQVEGAWSEDRAHLKVHLVAQTNQKTLWSQRLLASRSGDGINGYGPVSTVVFEPNVAALV
jgi:hypothetical protein